MVQRPVLDVVTSRLRRPGQNFVNRARLVTNRAFAQMSAEAGMAELDQLGWRLTPARDGHRRVVDQQVIKQTGETGHGQMQVLTNLAGDGSCLLDEFTAMPFVELQFAIG